ncbi:MAG: hypothetical protein KBT03_00795 [Bacteroidales bacterium]|nr:hypothetical protein [Candidatus Scybalousia scybalohippi]
MRADDVYALAMKGIRGCASGYSRAQRTGDNTFTIFFTNGDKVDLTIALPKDGVSVNDVERIDDTHFCLVLSNGTRTTPVEIPVCTNPEEILYTNTLVPDVKNVKEMLDYLAENGGEGGSAELTEELTATTPIGSVTSGKKYAKGTPLESIIRDILIKIEAPTVALSLVPSTAIYDVVNDSLASITLKAVVTKKTYGLKTVKFYDGTTLIDTQTITGGGSYTYTYAPATPINKTTTFKAIVEDTEGNTSESKTTVSFVGKSYYGIVASDIGTPTDAQVKGLTSVLKTTKGYTYSGITTDFGKVVYAYPKDMTELTSIKDPVNSYDYTSGFSKATVVIDGIDYLVYTQTEPSAAENVKLVFA